MGPIAQVVLKDVGSDAKSAIVRRLLEILAVPAKRSQKTQFLGGFRNITLCHE